MDRLIFPHIFDGGVNPALRKVGCGAKAFFTKKTPGVNIVEICRLLSLKEDEIYLPVQRHSDKVMIITSDPAPMVADGLLTNRKGILIGIQVADCVPVLLFDRERSVIGAVHAGWRGTAARILQRAIRLMTEYFHSSPEDIKIAFGPSIRWSCYRVGRDIKDAIYEATGKGDYYLRTEEGYCVDLPSANRYQAVSMGIPEENIWISQECTYCNHHAYYSYRYDKGLKGQQGGFIGIL